MRSARDQDMASGVISLGLLANKLAWYLTGGEDLPTLRLDKNMFSQWKTVLKETLDFIQSPEKGQTKQANAIPHFLSRAPYLEQIYTATPEVNRQNLKGIIAYLEMIRDNIDDLSKDKQLNTENRTKLLEFTETIARHSILEASRFFQETHSRTRIEPFMESVHNG